MKNLVLTIFFLVSVLCIGTTAYSQNKLRECAIVPYEKLDIKPKLDMDDGEGFDGWLFDNLKYPQIASITGAEGRVMFSFIVSREGDVEDVKILSGEKEFGNEIKRVMSMCPKWVPGELQGIKVGVRFIWKVDFSFYEEREESRITGQPVDPDTGYIIWHFDDLWDSWSDAASPSPDPIPYLIVAHKPTFKGDSVIPPGNLESFQEWVKKRINYPSSANGTQGRAVLRFVVTKNGAIDNIQVIKGVHDACDLEAVKIIVSSPKWEPGKNEAGEPVDVSITMPVVFMPQ